METPDRKVKTEDIFATDIFGLDIHTLADMNPMQSSEDFLALKHSIAEIGQQDPIVLFKGKVVDGRNRLQALKELYVDNEEDTKFKLVKYRKLPTTLSLDELEEIVIGKETRRHKTPVQKSIQALNYYTAKAELGENISMREAAKKFAVSVSAVSKILSLKKVAGGVVVQKLFNGDSISITALKKDGTIFTKPSTSPDAIRKHYQDMVEGTSGRYADTVEAQEMAYAQLEITRLLSTMSHDGIKYLVSGLERLKDIDKTSYNKAVIEAELGMTPKQKGI